MLVCASSCSLPWKRPPIAVANSMIKLSLISYARAFPVSYSEIASIWSRRLCHKCAQPSFMSWRIVPPFVCLDSGNDRGSAKMLPSGNRMTIPTNSQHKDPWEETIPDSSKAMQDPVEMNQACSGKARLPIARAASPVSRKNSHE